MRQINKAGRDLIKSFEGIADGDPTTVNLDPYLDPVGIWTIGWGHAIWVDGDFLRGKANRKRAFALYPGGIMMQQAEDLLTADLLDTCRDVEQALRGEKCPVSDNAFAALVSWAFNVARWRTSTLLRLVRECRLMEAANEFPKWRKAGGKVWPGLVRRRAAERKLFLA